MVVKIRTSGGSQAVLDAEVGEHFGPLAGRLLS